MIKECIKKIVDKEDLSFEEAYEVMDEIMSGHATASQIAAYLTGLTLKGESIDEITASAKCMRKHSKELKTEKDTIEIVGTGGDKSDSFNISSASAIVAAAGGCFVAKHGNRAASSKSGAADVLEALGININMGVDESKKLLEKCGFCFLYARNYHSAMKYAAPVRNEIGIRTIFNILGPLTNPANAKRQLLGVYSPDLTERLLKVLSKLGIEKGLSVCGQDGMDEISICAPTTVCEYENDSFKNYIIRPEDFGFKTCKSEEIKGGTPQENAQIIKNIFDGKENDAKKHIVCLNAGATLYAGGKTSDLAGGVYLAKELIENGAAKDKLREIITESSEVKCD